MKLSPLLALFAASLGMAQTSANPTISFPAPKVDSSDLTVAVPQRDWSALQKASQETVQRNLQEYSDQMAGGRQSGCPVVLTGAGLTPYILRLTSATDATGEVGGVDLEFRNASGKAIRSIEFLAEIRIKRSILDLDYLPQPVEVRLQVMTTGTIVVDENFSQLRHLALPKMRYPTLLSSVSPEQVTFADGSVWVPKTDDACGFSPSRTLQVTAR